LLNFLKAEVIAHLPERWEGHRVGEDGVEMLVLFVEAGQYATDEHMIGDVGAKVVEGVDEPLHFPVVIVHVEVALDEVAKGGADVEGAGLTIADELVF
jgi:hypothetical protein